MGDIVNMKPASRRERKRLERQAERVMREEASVRRVREERKEARLIVEEQVRRSMDGDLETTFIREIRGCQPATHGDGVVVAKESRGWSLRARRPFMKGQFITQYEGVLVSENDITRGATTPGKWSHLVSFPGKGGGIDGWKTPRLHRGAGAFANHEERPNATLEWEVSGVFLRALKDIKAGTAITISYTKRFLNSKVGACAHPGMAQVARGDTAEQPDKARSEVCEAKVLCEGKSSK